MFKRQGERRNPWSRRLGEIRKGDSDIEVEEEKRKGEPRKFDQRDSSILFYYPMCAGH